MRNAPAPADCLGQEAKICLSGLQTSQFALIDSGNFKRLEQFGKLKVQRPCAAAAWNIGAKDLWTDIDLEYKVPNVGKAAAAQQVVYARVGVFMGTFRPT